MAVSAQMLTCWLIVLMLWPSCAASSCSVTRSSLCASCTFACSTVSRVSRDTSVVSSCSCDEKSWIPSLTSATCARGGTVGRWDGGRAGAGDGCEPDGGPCPKATTTRSSSLKRAAAPGRIAGWEWFTSLLRFVGYHPPRAAPPRQRCEHQIRKLRASPRTKRKIAMNRSKQVFDLPVFARLLTDACHLV